MTSLRPEYAGIMERPGILAVLLAVFAAGCGAKAEPAGTVEGVVLLGNAPYANAAVVFASPKTGPAGTANVQGDGKFRLPGPLKVGKYTVSLAPKVAENAGETERPQPVSIDTSVPEKYWNEATSDVVVEIKEGRNDVTVQLRK